MQKYKVKVPATKSYKVVGICEYSVKGKWTKVKPMIGNVNEPITDDMLNEFIHTYKPEEINLFMIDSKKVEHYIDFPIEDLES